MEVSGKKKKKDDPAASLAIPQLTLDLLSLCTDDKFKGRPSSILLKPGSPIVSGENLYQGNILVCSNGTEGRVYGILFPDDTTFQECHDDENDIPYLLPSKMCTYVLMKLLGDVFNFEPFPGLPPGVIPIKPTRASFQDNENGPNAKFKSALNNYTLLQVPLTLNFGRTLHKLQGCSVDAIAGMEWSKEDCPSVYKAMMIYILLSRCRTLQGVFLHKKNYKGRS